MVSSFVPRCQRFCYRPFSLACSAPAAPIAVPRDGIHNSRHQSCGAIQVFILSTPVGGLHRLSQQELDLVTAFRGCQVVTLLVEHCRNLREVTEGVDLDGRRCLHIRVFEICVRQGDKFSLLMS
jgi:hypothetical protein